MIVGAIWTKPDIAQLYVCGDMGAKYKAAEGNLKEAMTEFGGIGYLTTTTMVKLRK